MTELDKLGIQITADDSGAVEQVGELKDSLNGLKDAVDNLGQGSGMKAVAEATETATGKMSDLNETVETTGQSASKTAEVMKSVSTEAQKYNALDYANAKTQYDLLVEKLDALAGKYVELQNSGKADPMKLNSLETQMNRTIQQIDRLTAKSKEGFGETANKVEEVANEAQSASGNIAQATQSTKKWADVAKTVSKHFNRLATVGRGITYPFTAPFRTATSLVKGLGSHIGKLGHQIKRVTLYRALRAGIRMVTEGIREGINNAYQWANVMGNPFASSMDNLASSALYLKNSLGAMAMPLINAVAPAIDYVIDKVVSLLNAINQLIARLTGASSWTRAVKVPKAYADSMADASKSAGKLKEELITILGIDEINPMEGANDTGSAGGGAGGGGADYSSMFEEVAVESDNFSKKLEEFFDPFKKAWDNKGKGVIDSVHNAMEGLQAVAEAVGESFWEVWTNGTGQETIEHILGILTGIFNIVGNIGKRFAEGWRTDNLGTSIIQHIWDILNDILGTWEDIATVTADWANTLDFEPILRSVDGLLGALEPLVDLIGDALAWGWENVLLPMAKWTLEEGAPVVIDLVTEALRLLGNIIKSSEPQFKFLWENFLKPLGSWTGKIVVQELRDFHDVLKDINDLLEGEIGLDTFLGRMFDRLIERIKRLIPVLQIILKLTKGDVAGAMNIIKTMKELTDAVEEVEKAGATVSEIGDAVGANVLDGISVPISVTGITDNIPKSDKKIGGFLAGLKTWAKEQTFGLTVGGMVAGLKNWAKEQTFGATIGGFFTAGLKTWTKEKTFSATIGGLAAGLKNWTKEKTFGATIGGLIASLTGTPKKEKGFVSTLTGLTAEFGSRKYGTKFDKVLYGLTSEFRYRQYSGKYDKVLYGLTSEFRYRQLSNKFNVVLGGLTAEFSKKQFASKVSNVISVVADIGKYVGVKTVGVTLQANNIITKGGQTLQVKAKGGSFYNNRWHDIPQYASGGAPVHGSLFMAGEAGAELVGHIGGHTEVLNQSQLASALAGGMAPQTQLLAQLVEVGQQLLAGQGNVKAVVSTGDMVDGLQRKNRRDGRTVVPVGA